jgi:predicted lactoylglutathione lyase
MIIGDNIFAMLLVEKYFATFTTKPVADAKKGTEVLIALSLDSRDAVEAHVKKAVAAGHHADGGQGPWIHVPTRLPGPRRPPVGSLLHGYE